MSYFSDLRTWQREYLTKALKKSKGNVVKAARACSINRTHFYKMMRIHGIKPMREPNEGNAAWKALSRGDTHAMGA